MLTERIPGFCFRVDIFGSKNRIEAALNSVELLWATFKLPKFLATHNLYNHLIESVNQMIELVNHMIESMNQMIELVNQMIKSMNQIFLIVWIKLFDSKLFD